MSTPTTKLKAPAVEDLRRGRDEIAAKRKRAERGDPPLITKRDMDIATGRHVPTFRDHVEAVLQEHGASLSTWIGQIAYGIKRPVSERAQHGTWAVAPNPSLALTHITAIAEFAVPKLSRTEITGPAGGALQVEVVALVAQAQAAKPAITSPVIAPDVVDVEVPDD